MVDVLFFNGRPVGRDAADLRRAAGRAAPSPASRATPRSNTTKPATMETGLEVQVPLFIDEGEVLKIDTRTGAYVERVKSE